MVTRFPLLLAGLSALAGQAQAGAWARGEGESFLSLSYGQTTAQGWTEGTGALYFEHGLGHGLTAGLKLDQRAVGPHELEFFLRRNVNASDAALQVAVEVGLSYRLDGRLDETWRGWTGAAQDDPAPEDPADYRDEIEITPGFEGLLNPDLQFGTRYLVDPESDDPVTVAFAHPTVALHLGRGFGSPFALAGWELPGGWWDMRLGLDLPVRGEDVPVAEFDAILGLSVTERTFLTFEIWHDATVDDSLTSVVPGIGVRLGDRYAVTLRHVRDLDGLPDSVELGTWIEF